MTDLAKLTEMMLRGRDYTETKEVEVFGESLTLTYRPIDDELYYPLVVYLDQKLGISEDEAIEKVEEALEEADGEAAEIDMSLFDQEFVQVMKLMCRLGIKPDEGDEEQLDEAFGSFDPDRSVLDQLAGRPATFGGYVLEWGMDIMSVTGDLRDAKKFRGGRNRT
jgi:hypothetical protein